LAGLLSGDSGDKSGEPARILPNSRSH